VGVSAAKIREKVSDPIWFTKNILKANLWSKQEEIMRSCWQNKRTSVRTCHGIGKSFLAGNAILAFLYGQIPSIILSTAPTWRQVEKLVWKEVRASYRRAAIPLGGKLSPKRPELQIQQDEWYAAGLSTNDPDRFQGFHEANILVVVDEAAGIPEEIFEGIEGILTSENAHLLLLGNPTSVGGTFYNSFKEPGWSTFHISAFDTPNFTAFGITEEDMANNTWREKIAGRPLPNPKMITPEWVYDKYKRWKPGSVMYEARVLGNFPASGNDTLIPLNWIELAIERWEEMEECGVVELGIDVARFGEDNTVLAPKIGDKVLELEVYSKLDTMETTGYAIQAHKHYKSTNIKVDIIGIGAGVYDRLIEQSYPAVAVNVAESASEAGCDKFANKRSELYWHLRERLDPDPRINPRPIALPPDEDMMLELASIKYKIDSKGKIVIEPKEEMKKRIGRSPDRADAVMIAVAPEELICPPDTMPDIW